MGFNAALREAGEFGCYQRRLCFGFLLPAIAYLSLCYWAQIFVLMAPADCTSHPRFYTAATENDWVCENAWRVYVVHTFYWVGSILGQLFFGCLTDRLGRKKTFCWVVLLSVLSNLGTIVAPDHLTFTIARFLTAFGISTISTTSFMIVMEYTGPRNRTVVLCTWAAAWTSCAAVLPWVAYALTNWRYLLCVPFAPAAVLLVVSWWVPESASWLMTKGQVAKASELLEKVARVNGKNLSSQYFYDLLITSTAEANASKPEKKESFMQTSLGLVKYPNMRKKTFVLLISWLVIHLCYNGNSLQTGRLPFSAYVCFSAGACLEMPVNLLCILSLDRLGRKWPDVVCLVLGGFLCALSGCVEGEGAQFALALLVRVAFAAATNITFQYTAELFPTEVRGRGLSLQRMCGALGSCLAPPLLFLAEVERVLPMLLLGAVSLGAGALLCVLPETAGLPLPHTLEEGERLPARCCTCCSSELEDEESRSKFGRDNPGAEVPQGTHGLFILTAKETEAKL